MYLARPALLSLGLLAGLALAQDSSSTPEPSSRDNQGGSGPFAESSASDTASPDADPSSAEAGGTAEPVAPSEPAAHADAPPVQAPAERAYVAVVIGISSYRNLPDATELNFGRSDAATVADALRKSANYDQVFLLGDGEANREEIAEILHTQVPQLVGSDDVFLLYFVGHGIGADLGLPVLLAHDSTLQSGQEDGFELSQFARDLQTWIRAGTALIVTDTVHRNQLDGISFFGPAAADWPTMPPGWMLLSASESQQPGRDGAFGAVFAEAISGGADANRDGVVTTSELHAYLVSRLSPTGQVPSAAGQFRGNQILASDVHGGPSAAPADPKKDTSPPKDEPDEEPQQVLPDWSVSAAKFVWAGGSGQSVQCRQQPVTACAPSCYVRDFLAGPCALRGIFEGVELSGRVMVLGPGKYDCARKGGELVCSGP